MLERIEVAFARRRALLWLSTLAVALCLPALRLGLQNDDYLFSLKVAQRAPAWDLFDFRDAGWSTKRESGFLPWWAAPGVQQRFLRPLSSLTHALEFSYWPHAPWLMLLTNALIYGACVALAAALYRRLSPSPASASSAALLFATDQAHATSVGWISGRNTLLATMFSLAALLAQVRGSARAGVGWKLASSGAVAFALLSAEAGTWSLALLIAYALVMEPGSWCARLGTVAPQLTLGGIWAASYVAFGFGMHGSSSYYRDPSSLGALAGTVLDLPIWASSLLGAEGASLALFLPEPWARLLVLPSALFVLWLTWPGLRTSKECRMYALACLFSVAPLLLTLPNARVLIGPNFGALGWIGCVVADSARGVGGRARWQGQLLLWTHLGLGALFPFALGSVGVLESGTRALAATVDPSREVVVLRSPLELIGSFARLSLAHAGRPAPRALHQLYIGSGELGVERGDANSIEVAVARGWGYAPVERLACGADALPRPGSKLRLRGMTVQVLQSTSDGRPRRVRFTFPTPLESSGRQWLVWQAGDRSPGGLRELVSASGSRRCRSFARCRPADSGSWSLCTLLEFLKPPVNGYRPSATRRGLAMILLPW